MKTLISYEKLRLGEKMILSQKHDILYKERMSHKHKMQVTAQKSLNYNFRKPFLERDEKEVSFKGGFSLATLKKAFSPYVKKTYDLKNNLAILKENIGEAPIKLNAETANWTEIGPYLNRSGNSIEITEKNWPTLLWEGIIYPVRELPFHLGRWVKNMTVGKRASSSTGMIHDTTGATNYVKRKYNTLDNTDIVNSFSGYMESANKYKQDSKEVQSAGLFTQAMKMFDPKTGNYNGVHERALTRIVTGLIPAFFLANDAYNLSRLCDDDEQAAQKEKKLRFNQEIKRVMSNAYLQLITLGALSKYVNKNIASFVGVTAITVFITEAYSRLSNGKKIHFISKEEAIELNKKEAAKNKNKTENKDIETKPEIKAEQNQNSDTKSNPAFKGSNVFKAFGIAADIPTDVNLSMNQSNAKEMKPLLSVSVLAKWFVGTMILGVALKKAQGIKIAENIKIKDLLSVISQKYDNLYNKITQKEFKIPKKEFENIIQKLKNYDKVIGTKIEELALRKQKVDTIKSEATQISNILKEAGMNEESTFFENLYNLKLNKKFKDLSLYNKAKEYFAQRDKRVILKNLNKLFDLMKREGFKDEAAGLKNIILDKQGAVDTKQYTKAYKYIEKNANDFLSTFQNRFKVDTEAEILKKFNSVMEELKSHSPEQAEELLKKVKDSTEAEFISLGKKNIKGVREAADFITEPFKFIWGTITLPYKHVAKYIYQMVKGEKELPKWDKEFDAAANLLTRLRQKQIFSRNNTPMIERSEEEFAKYMNKQINKAYNTSTMSSLSNSDLSAMAKNTSTAATIWFLMADNHNMVMLKSNGNNKNDAQLKAKERLVQETSRNFYNVMFINLFNNTFRTLFNTSLFGAQTVNTASTLIGEYVNRVAIGVPVGEHSRDEIISKDNEHLNDKTIKGDFFRFMSRLTGKKALTQREQPKK